MCIQHTLGTLPFFALHIISLSDNLFDGQKKQETILLHANSNNEIYNYNCVHTFHEEASIMLTEYIHCLRKLCHKLCIAQG